METDEAIGAPLGPRIPEIYIESFSIAFSPDSCRIVLGSGDRDRAIYLWNAETSEAICEPMKGHKGRVTSVAFSSDGNRIVSGSCDGIRLWNAETGETIEGHRIVTGSEEGRTLSGPAIRIWNVETIEGSILLSLNPEHALTKPDAFLGSLPTSDKYDYSDLLTMQENGWLVGPESRLLLWLPSENRQSVDFLQGFANIDWPTTSLDLSKYAHGTNWHECYTEYSDDVDE
ncbi:WD40-repeat-containing domain protein [Amylostereum chailletii]|nr:WD40-repeat-containing domain protein [Amylostereum chailletii]